MMQVSNRVRTALTVAKLLPAYLLFGLFKHVVPLQRLVRWASSSPIASRDPAAERRFSEAVLRLSSLIGRHDRDCLQRSLLLYRVLSRNGADPVLVIGVDRSNGKFLGHAWVTVDGCTLIEREADLVRFTELFQFSSRGTLIRGEQFPASLATSAKIELRP